MISAALHGWENFSRSFFIPRSPQASSEYSVDHGSACVYSSLPMSNFIYSTSTYGATEGGSSGSPVVNKLGQVVGQLYGVRGSHLDGKCDYNNNYIIDGRFSVTSPNVQLYLGSSSPTTTTTQATNSTNTTTGTTTAAITTTATTTTAACVGWNGNCNGNQVCCGGRTYTSFGNNKRCR